MFCKNCKAHIDDNSLFCMHCGAPQNNAGTTPPPPYYNAPPMPQKVDPVYKVGGFVLGLFTFPTGFITAIIALVFYVVYKPDRPEKASEIGKWALIGIAVSLVLSVLFVMLGILFVTGLTSTVVQAFSVIS